MTTMTPPICGLSIWERVVAPLDTSLSPAVANELLKLGFAPQDHDRMALLAGKAREGSLTPHEQSEIDEYGLVNSLLGILKSKARLSLRNHPKS